MGAPTMKHWLAIFLALTLQGEISGGYDRQEDAEAACPTCRILEVDDDAWEQSLAEGNVDRVSEGYGWVVFTEPAP